MQVIERQLQGRQERACQEPAGLAACWGRSEDLEEERLVACLPREWDLFVSRGAQVED